jgi:hypothetical protein
MAGQHQQQGAGSHSSRQLVQELQVVGSLHAWAYGLPCCGTLQDMQPAHSRRAVSSF